MKSKGHTWLYFSSYFVMFFLPWCTIPTVLGLENGQLAAFIGCYYNSETNEELTVSNEMLYGYKI